MAMLSAHAVVRAVRERVRRLLHRRRSLAEPAARPPGELERTARDVGVSADDVRIVAAAHPGAGELMPQRLALLGLDPAYVKSALTDTYRDLERTCASCTAWGRCAQDLAMGDVQAGMGSYCLCAPTVDALTVGQGRPAPDMACEPWPPARRPLPWPMYRRVERRAVRMHEMMRRLDVDPARLARLRRGDAYAEARSSCLSCGASDMCLHWLDAPSTGDKRPEFCPNLALFEGCRRDRVGA